MTQIAGSPGGEGAARRALTIVLFLAAGTVVILGMRALSDIVGPVLLALVVTVSLHPIRVRLERRLPGWLTSVVMLVIAYVVLAALTLALVVAVAQLAALIPQYADEMTDLVADATEQLESLGVDESQIQAVASSLDPGQLVDVAVALLEGVLGVLGNLFFLFTVLLFITFDTDSTRRSLTSVVTRVPHVVAALRNFARGTRSYMGVSASFGLIVALIDWAVLSWLDIPGAFVWAVLAFVTNFIPNIGFVIGLAPPALIALLDGGPDEMLVVIALYSVINFVIQSIIQPRVVGDTVGLSTLLTFLSLVFWTAVIGPLGALLAVPLSLLARAVLIESDPRNQWLLPVVAGKPVLESDEPDDP